VIHTNDHNLIQLPLPDEAATLALGARLAPLVAPGWVVYLEGDLGAGKTTLVRGMLRGLGYPGRVKSPTYTLIEVHTLSELHWFHLDFYRLHRAEEYLDAGLDEYFVGHGVCLVEWPDKAAPYLPSADLRIALAVVGSGRAVRIEASSARGQACLTNLAAAVATFSNTPPRA
jgi:tRNA threonylcarbamoyladenosine biosynthesis protein TsaE